MARTRLDLHKELVEMLGSNNVYYQPPETIKMEYPAIVYSRSNFRNTYADDSIFFSYKQYEIIVISKKPDDSVIDKLLKHQLCSHNRQYKSDNLYHDVFTLYY